MFKTFVALMRSYRNRWERRNPAPAARKAVARLGQVLPPEDEDQALNVILTCLIEHAGGRYVGIQRAIPGVYEIDLVMFVGPCGSTIALKLEECNTDIIRQRIADKEALFAKFPQRPNANA
jgi:hypothetical protein